MPVIGGRIADQILGSRWAVLLGGVLMAIGEFIIVGGTEMLLFWGMAVIIVGNCLFKPNISTMVGKLYEDGDPRKDSGFTIFYIGINLGALLATTVCAESEYLRRSVRVALAASECTRSNNFPNGEQALRPCKCSSKS